MPSQEEMTDLMREAGFHPAQSQQNIQNRGKTGPIMDSNDMVLMKSRFDDARQLRNKQI